MAIRNRLATESLDSARTLNNLGNVSLDLGELSVAAEYHRKALAMKERLAPGTLSVAMSLNNLGLVSWKQGDPASARDYFLKALKIQERLSPDSLDTSRSFNNLANVALDIGDLSRAKEFYLKALAIQERLAPGSLEVATILNNLGDLASDLAEPVEARECYRRALAIQERLAPDSLDTARSYNNLGNVALKYDDPGAARVSYRKALEIRQRLAPDSLDVARSLDNLGDLARRDGDTTTAGDFHRRAMAIRERLAPDGLEMGDSLDHLGNLFQIEGKPAAAREFLRRALVIRERLAPGSFALAESLRNLAGVERASGDLTRCTELLVRAVDTLETQRSRAGGETAKTSFSAAHGDFYTDLIETFLEVKQPEKSLETLERSRARTLLEMLASRWIDLGDEIPAGLLARQRELASRRKTLTDLLARADGKTGIPQIDAAHTELLLLPQKEDALAEEIRKTSARLGALQYPKPLDFHGIVDALDPGTLLVAYTVTEKETFLFTLRKEVSSARNDRGPTASSRPKATGRAVFRVFRLAAGRKELENRVKAIRAALRPGTSSGRLSRTWEPKARDLFRVLLSPASAEITVSRRILLMPDGPLHLLPFGALVPDVPKSRARPGRAASRLEPLPLGLQRPISLQSSMTVYAGMKTTGPRQRKAGRGSWIGFGDPVYPEPAAVGPSSGEGSVRRANRLHLESLPGTRKELERILALVGEGNRALLGTEATEEAVRVLAAPYAYLHLACHGLVDADFPMNSALALSLPQEPPPETDYRKDGLLQAWEIIQDLRLDADCAILSACETGVGRVQGGEGIMGLTRAFLYAGSRSVVVSLWPISDDSTVLFMETFYREVLAGVPRDAALQQARKKLAGSDAFSHPGFWAVFELYGRSD